MRALFATWEGGGHVPAALIVAQCMAERGVEVLFVSDEANRPQAESRGLNFLSWRTATNRTVIGAMDEPLRDWKARTPWGVVKSVCDAVMCGPSGAYATDAAALIRSFSPDVVVSQELLFGVMAAAESANVKLALLTGNLWCFPNRYDIPPFGPGFPPARTAFQRRREQSARRIISRLYDVGLEDLNRTRQALGLTPLQHVLDQLDVAGLILIGTSHAFDFCDGPTPAPFRYAGPLISTPDWANKGSPPIAGGSNPANAPLVLVSFSTTYQAQRPVIVRCIKALADLPVRGLVTLGPALRSEDLPRAPNVEMVQAAPHDVIVPRCDMMVCHGGHGTVIRALIFGKPVICMPMGRDQPENAIRISDRGAGLTLSHRASSNRIQRAIMRVLQEPSFRENSEHLGQSIAEEADGGRSAGEALETFASCSQNQRSSMT